jgi:hypothetical protein
MRGETMGVNVILQVSKSLNEVMRDALIIIKGLKAKEEALKRIMKNAQIVVDNVSFVLSYT